MTDFQLYFELGRAHIMDITAYDHILFVMALCTIYQVAEWKKVLILVTAFTIGHSLTLALVTLDLIAVNSAVVEFLIPVTILITALGNIRKRNVDFHQRASRTNYFFALFFGLIHGLGFSNYLKALLGTDTDIIGQLFAFNVGLEVGQVLIVLIFMGIAAVLHFFFHIARRDWILAVSSAIAGIAVMLMIETKFW
ncbi:HupE/UreJ family protein [Reichenbachiella agariperforans]|uniref:HupE / UreJ protein n=1 Tax=Reichenbachiella agariperforans TaxID=156994 RepID=A0A1M6QJF9_REIAG|nr:HupE/UreJ family protein [Reichenbachiella agariperforans]MBU2914399.1 HupE/UreJ family protein [Reichenbachiella agariperforans]SHK20409.1 HupE / UreJ protein [Reichenbachiella agariperforans]